MTRFQPFNDLPASQQEALKRDVEVRGIVNPILVDENDKTIDGHQRRRVAAELGIECPRIVLEGLTDDEKMSLAIALNTFRRHLTGVERSVALQKMAQLGMSQRRIAAATGVSPRTVRRDLAKQVPGGAPAPPEDGTKVRTAPEGVDPETGELMSAREGTHQPEDTKVSSPTQQDHVELEPPRVVGRDGKSYPATKPKPSEADILAARIAASDTGYRAAVSRETSKTRDGLLKLDAQRAADICLPDDRRSAESFCEDVRAWVDAYETALKRSTLRSVK